MSKLHVEAKRVESTEMNILEEGVCRNTRIRLGMDELSMVFTNMLMESTCCSGLCAVHSELGESHRRRKFVTTKSHSKGSKISHSISS